MKAYGKRAAFIAVLVGAGHAFAQAAPDTGGSSETNPPASPTVSAPATENLVPAPVSRSGAEPTQVFGNERHLVGRVLGGVGFRLNDIYNAGALAPPWMLVEAHFLFANVGPLRMGPSLGFQAGFDSHSGAQWDVQPGWFVHWRLSRLFGLTGRLDVPFVVTGGKTGASNQNIPGAPPVMAPLNPTLAFGIGIEPGIGALVYLTNGIALTAEVNFDFYFGDTYTFSVLGLGLGVVVDYELLP